MGKTVLVTGATGFVGSAVALLLLKRGCKVLSLERGAEPGDPRAPRTYAKVEAAARAFGLSLDDDDRARLRGLPFDLQRLQSDLGCLEVLRQVDAVWHCAAEMTFSPKRYADSFAFNVGTTVDLYRLVEAHARSPQRFYYVSTAYVAGLQSGPIPEDILIDPVPCNTYVATKWAAEMALHACVAKGARLPVTVYRTSSVVGHSQTGGYWGNAFALYALIEILAASAQVKNRVLHIDLDPEVIHPYLPVDALARNAAALICDRGDDAPFTVVHDLGTEWTDGGLTHAMDDMLGIETRFGPPQTDVDKMIDAKIEKYKPLHSTLTPRPYRLAHQRLRDLLGDAYAHSPLDRATLRRLAGTYFETRATRA
jgi:nucleoside-diphosphate-sugar epimerase